jgi:signal transduction histidine kinase
MELQSRDFPYRGHPARVTAVRDLSLGRQAQEQIQVLQAEEALKREQAQRESFARQLILAQEKERERIAAELHDGLGQNVLVMKHQAERGLAETANPTRMRESLTAILGLAGQSVHDIRGIVRHLHPYLLRQLGLTRALRAMVDTLNQSSAISFTADLEPVDHLLVPESEIAFYRVLQECLNNVVKHSQATAATVGVRREPGGLTAWVQDDGCGFDLDPLGSGDRGGAGMGLRGITERMHLLGGASRFVTQPGKGVRVELRLPLAPPSPAGHERSGLVSGLQPNHTPTLG